MAEITVYSTCWCCDCRRAKQFLRERKIPFREVNIDESPECGRDRACARTMASEKFPRWKSMGASSHAARLTLTLLAEELKIPLNK